MAKVTVNRPSIYPFNGLTLMPGVNKVSDEEMKMLKGQKGVLRDVKRGILSLDGQKKPGRPSKSKDETKQEQDSGGNAGEVKTEGSGE